MQKSKLIRRLQWYYPTEKFNAWLFLGITIYVTIAHNLSNSFFLIYGLLLMTFILFQGQHYWKLKLYRLTNKNFNQTKNIQFFKRCKKINFILILLIPVVFALQWVVSKDTSRENNLILWGLLANTVGVFEHINYYYRQLMIDNVSDIRYLIQNKKLKVASLKKDLNENKL